MRKRDGRKGEGRKGKRRKGNGRRAKGKGRGEKETHLYVLVFEQSRTQFMEKVQKQCMSCRQSVNNRSERVTPTQLGLHFLQSSLHLQIYTSYQKMLQYVA